MTETIDNTPPPEGNAETDPLVPATPAGAHSPALPYSGDQIKTAHVAAGTPPEQIDHLIWFLVHGRSRGLSTDGLGQLLLPRRDSTTIGRVFRATYAASIRPIVDAISAYRRGVEQGPSLGGSNGDQPFVETRLAREIGGFLDLARASRTIGLIWGENQSGKSTALREYQARNNHGRTVYVRMPTGGTTRRTLNGIAKACGISERHSFEQLTEKVIRYFGPDVLLIIDEAHQACGGGRSVKVSTLDIIREIHDVTGCGVVLCGTNALPDSLRNSGAAKFLEQFDNRGALRMEVRTRPYREDLAAVLQSYGLPCSLEGRRRGDSTVQVLSIPDPEAARIAEDVANKKGIGKLIQYVRLARRLAMKKEVPLAWSHFVATYVSASNFVVGEEDN